MCLYAACNAQICEDFNGGQAQKCTRMGMTILKLIIYGGILSDIQLELTFYGSTDVTP